MPLPLFSYRIMVRFSPFPSQFPLRLTQLYVNLSEGGRAPDIGGLLSLYLH